MECIFCKITKKEMPTNMVHEDRDFVVFHDINPKAPLHLLIVPKKHIPSINHLEPGDKELMGELILAAQKVAKDHHVSGYRLQFNVGREGGQVIDHIHLHLLAQKPL